MYYAENNIHSLLYIFVLLLLFVVVVIVCFYFDTLRLVTFQFSIVVYPPSSLRLSCCSRTFLVGTITTYMYVYTYFINVCVWGFFITRSESSGSTTHSFLSLTPDTYTQTFWRFSANICVWMSWHPLYFYCIQNVCVMPWNIFTKEVSSDMFLIFLLSHDPFWEGSEMAFVSLQSVTLNCSRWCWWFPA